MLIFGWNKDLECNIELIDSQHKKIFQYANAFFIKYAVQKEREINGAKELLQFLQDFILYHFQAEEAFQVECNYPDYLEHQAIHKMISQRVKFLSVELEESGYSAEKMKEFENFTRDWIVNHIMKEDMEFAKCYKEYLDEKEKKE